MKSSIAIYRLCEVIWEMKPIRMSLKKKNVSVRSLKHMRHKGQLKRNPSIFNASLGQCFVHVRSLLDAQEWIYRVFMVYRGTRIWKRLLEKLLKILVNLGKFKLKWTERVIIENMHFLRRLEDRYIVGIRVEKSKFDTLNSISIFLIN